MSFISNPLTTKCVTPHVFDTCYFLDIIEGNITDDETFQMFVSKVLVKVNGSNGG